MASTLIVTKQALHLPALMWPGIAALILERNPYLTVTQVNDIIEKSTVKVGDMPYNETRKNGTWNSHYGYGMANAYKAVMNTPRP